MQPQTQAQAQPKLAFAHRNSDNPDKMITKDGLRKRQNLVEDPDKPSEMITKNALRQRDRQKFEPLYIDHDNSGKTITKDALYHRKRQEILTPNNTFFLFPIKITRLLQV